MGNTLPCCFTGSRQSNRILPTNSTVLAFGVVNKDLALYRRHKKRCDAEHGSNVASEALENTNANERESLQQEPLQKSEDCINSLDYRNDKEMMDWVSSILIQNHLLPSYMTFDNKRHSSMRAKYADIIQVINLCNIIHETKDEEQRNPLKLSKNLNGLKKDGKQKIKKHLSHETFNLGLGPSPKISTRISKDAVKRNKQKDSQLKFQASKNPPPPKSLLSGSNASTEDPVKFSESKDSRKLKSETENPGKQFHVSSNWLDEDFEESMLSYPSELPKTKAIPQCSRPSSKPNQQDHGKKNKSIKFKIEPEISEPAVHNIGLFLSASEGDQFETKRGRILDAFRKKKRASPSCGYAVTDSFFSDDDNSDSYRVNFDA